jgi:hypothetical protein
VRKAAEVMLLHLVYKVSRDLDLKLTTEFTSAVFELQNEFNIPTSHAPTIHQRIVGVLHFGDSLNGTVQLATAIACYLPLLYTAAQRLIRRP